eukprot:9478306-Lingulodinium_polyedra.AAC.1
MVEYSESVAKHCASMLLVPRCDCKLFMREDCASVALLRPCGYAPVIVQCVCSCDASALR